MRQTKSQNPSDEAENTLVEFYHEIEDVRKNTRVWFIRLEAILIMVGGDVRHIRCATYSAKSSHRVPEKGVEMFSFT